MCFSAWFTSTSHYAPSSKDCNFSLVGEHLGCFRFFFFFIPNNSAIDTVIRFLLTCVRVSLGQCSSHVWPGKNPHRPWPGEYSNWGETFRSLCANLMFLWQYHVCKRGDPQGTGNFTKWSFTEEHLRGRALGNDSAEKLLGGTMLEHLPPCRHHHPVLHRNCTNMHTQLQQVRIHTASHPPQLLETSNVKLGTCPFHCTLVGIVWPFT